MILISHRGNIDGRVESYENEPNYVDKALAKGYDVEIDVWYVNEELFLGHDRPQYRVNQKWIQDRKDELWIHCKNIDSIVYFNYRLVNRYNYFWHQEDTVTLTAEGYIWAYPGKQPIKNSIAVMPELYDDDITSCLGVCSDKIEYYSHKIKLT